MLSRLALVLLCLPVLPQDPAPYVTGRTLAGFDDQVTALRFLKDGKHLASAGWDGKVHLWSVETWKEVRALEFPGSQLMDIAVSPDGTQLAVVGTKDVFRVHETRTWTEVRRFSAPAPKDDEEMEGEPPDPAEWEYFSVAWAPDSRHVATGNQTKLAEIWDVKGGKNIRKLKGHTYFVLSVAFSPDGKTVVSGSTDGSTRVWNPESGKQVQVVQEEKGVHPMRVAYSADGKLCAVGMTTGLVKVFDAKTWKVLKSLPGAGVSVAFSPDGKYLAGAAPDKSITLVETATWKTLASLKGHSRDVQAIAFSPDGKYLVSGAEKEILVWDRK